MAKRKSNKDDLIKKLDYVIKHLKGDIADFKEEADEDRALIKKLKRKKKKK